MKKICLLLFMLLPATAMAEGWTLDSAGSNLNAVSVKSGSVAEIHHFNGLTGLATGKHASVVIDLASIESGIDIRNERMRSMLFDVSRFATATITADIAQLNVRQLKAGQSIAATVPVSLDLHGIKRELSAEITVTAMQDGLLVTSRMPVIVQAVDFDLTAGIEALRKVAGLPAIAQAVPVSFQLYFKGS